MRIIKSFLRVFFGKGKPKTVGFLRRPSTQYDDDKKPKGSIGFKKN